MLFLYLIVGFPREGHIILCTPISQHGRIQKVNGNIRSYKRRLQKAWSLGFRSFMDDSPRWRYPRRYHWSSRSYRGLGRGSSSRATDRSLPSVAAADGRVKKRHDRAKPVTVSLTSTRPQTSKGLIADTSHHFPGSSAHWSTGRVEKGTDVGFSGDRSVGIRSIRESRWLRFQSLRNTPPQTSKVDTSHHFPSSSPHYSTAHVQKETDVGFSGDRSVRIRNTRESAWQSLQRLTSTHPQTSKGLIADTSYHFPSSSAHCSAGRVQKKTDIGFSGDRHIGSRNTRESVWQRLHSDNLRTTQPQTSKTDIPHHFPSSSAHCSTGRVQKETGKRFSGDRTYHFPSRSAHCSTARVQKETGEGFSGDRCIRNRSTQETVWQRFQHSMARPPLLPSPPQPPRSTQETVWRQRFQHSMARPPLLPSPPKPPKPQSFTPSSQPPKPQCSTPSSQPPKPQCSTPPPKPQCSTPSQILPHSPNHKVKHNDIIPHHPSSSSLQLPHRERVVALDCEMVGITAGKLSALGRCSIVQYNGEVIFDEFVQPDEPITDYRTPWSGITRSDMRNALPMQEALEKIHRILSDKIVVGHALQFDFDVLKYFHPGQDTRDTSMYVPVRVLAGTPTGSTPSLKNLAASLLGRRIQRGSHCSVVDATAALDIYKLVEQRWEKEPPSALCRYAPRMMRSKKRIKKTTLKLKVAKKDVMLSDRYWSNVIT